MSLAPPLRGMGIAAAMILLTFCNLKSDPDLERGIVELKKGDTTSAIEFLSKAHARGNEDATKRLFRIYALGLGIAPDDAHALEFLRQMPRADARREVEGVIIAFEEGHYSTASPSAANRWRLILRRLEE